MSVRSLVSHRRLLVPTALASLAVMLAADVAVAQVGGGGRGPTLFGRNRNSAQVRWWAQSFGPNTRIRRFAEGRDVATGRPLPGVYRPLGSSSYGTPWAVTPRTTAPRPAVRTVTPAAPAPPTRRVTRTPTAAELGLPPGARVIAIDGVPVD